MRRGFLRDRSGGRSRSPPDSTTGREHSSSKGGKSRESSTGRSPVDHIRDSFTLVLMRHSLLAFSVHIQDSTAVIRSSALDKTSRAKARRVDHLRVIFKIHGEGASRARRLHTHTDVSRKTHTPWSHNILPGVFQHPSTSYQGAGEGGLGSQNWVYVRPDRAHACRPSRSNGESYEARSFTCAQPEGACMHRCEVLGRSASASAVRRAPDGI